MADPNKPTIEEVELAFKLNEALKIKNDLIAKGAAASVQEKIAAEERIDKLEKEIKLEQESTENRLEKISDLKAEISTLKDGIEKKQKQLDLERLILEQRKKTGDITDKDYKAAKDDLAIQEKKLQNLREQDSTLKRVSEKVDLITGGFSKQVIELFSVDGVLKSIGMQFQAILKGNSEFARETGQVADRITGFGAGLANFGIGFEKLNKTSIDLFLSMSNFSNLNKEMQADLATSAAKMNNLGISVATTGKNYDLLTKSLRVSSDQAKKINEDIAKAAIGAGIAPKKMAEEFGSSMSSLSAYGKQGIDVYIDLQKQAKSLGMELGTLNSIIGDQFDTFEGAARAAGKFNAVLGGNYLNSVEMLNATESERILLLKQSFDASGKNFDSLSKYERKAVAATLGIKDLNEASKLFGKSTTELAQDMNKQAASADKLEESQKAAADTLEKLTNIFNGFLIIISPIVNIINGLVSAITSISPAWSLAIGSMILFIGVLMKLTGVFSFLGNLISGFGAKISSWVGFTNTAAGATQNAGSAMNKSGIISFIKRLGSAATKSAKGLLALGASMLMIGAGIAAAALGFAQLVAAFKDLNADQTKSALIAIGLVMAGFIIILKILTGVTIAAVLPMNGLALAFLGIGAGIGIAAAGLAFLVDRLTGFFSTLKPENTEAILMLSGALLGLSATFIILGVAAPLALIAIGVLAIAIIGLRKAFSSLEPTTIKAFSSALENMFSILKFEGISERFSALSTGIKSIGAALNELPENKTIALQTLNETLNTAKTITEDNIKPTKEFISVAKEYYQVQATSKEADKDTLVAALKEIKSAMAPKETKAASEAVPVKLVISGTDLATALKSGNTTVNALLHGLTGF